MKVWRVEHKKYKRGPYRFNEIKSGKHCESMGLCGVSSFKQPMPYDDGLKIDTSGSKQPIRYGFDSEAKLKRWFGAQDRRNLKKHGFVVNVYDVPEKHVQIGRNQLVFLKSQAKLVRQAEVI